MRATGDSDAGAMSLPLLRQLREDPLGLGRAARSKRTDSLQARTKTAEALEAEDEPGELATSPL